MIILVLFNFFFNNSEVDVYKLQNYIQNSILDYCEWSEDIFYTLIKSIHSKHDS